MKYLELKGIRYYLDNTEALFALQDILDTYSEQQKAKKELAALFQDVRPS